MLVSFRCCLTTILFSIWSLEQIHCLNCLIVQMASLYYVQFLDLGFYRIHLKCPLFVLPDVHYKTISKLFVTDRILSEYVSLRLKFKVMNLEPKLDESFLRR